MLMSYQDCKNRYKNGYQVKKALELGLLYKIAPGIYADAPHVSDLERVSFKYGRAVFTMDSAFYYHGMTDVIPEQYHLATLKGAHRIGEKEIKQYFYGCDTFSVGISSVQCRGTTIRIYDKERMLIELIRKKRVLPFDFYKEVIKSYRKEIEKLDIEKLQEYILFFANPKRIWETIELEVI